MVISSPLDYSTTIAETTQSRKLLKIILNKFYEVTVLSAIENLLSYVKNFFFGVRGFYF